MDFIIATRSVLNFIKRKMKVKSTIWTIKNEIWTRIHQIFYQKSPVFHSKHRRTFGFLHKLSWKIGLSQFLIKLEFKRLKMIYGDKAFLGVFYISEISAREREEAKIRRAKRNEQKN